MTRPFMTPEGETLGAAYLALLAAWHNLAALEALPQEPRFDFGAGPVALAEAAASLAAQEKPVYLSGEFVADHLRLGVATLREGSPQWRRYEIRQMNNASSGIAHRGGQAVAGRLVLVYTAWRGLKLLPEAMDVCDRDYHTDFGIGGGEGAVVTPWVDYLELSAEELNGVGYVSVLGRQTPESPGTQFIFARARAEEGAA